MHRTRAVTSVLRSWLVAVPLLASHASAQQRGAPDTLPAALWNGPAATFCLAGVPTSVFAAGPSADLMAQLAVHEAVHRRQLAGDCDRTLQAIVADRRRYAEMEAEAGCAQLEAVTGPGRHAFDLGTLSGWLQARFPDLTADTLNALIARRCGLWRAS